MLSISMVNFMSVRFFKKVNDRKQMQISLKNILFVVPELLIQCKIEVGLQQTGCLITKHC